MLFRSVSAVLGYEAKKNHYKYFYGEGTGYISDNFLELDNAAQAVEVGGSYTDDRLVSYLAKGDYSYSDKYYFSASYRMDGSSRLAKDERWGNFYAVSAAWDLSKEGFLAGNENINNLNVDIIEADLVKIVKRYVKHNANALAKIIMEKILKIEVPQGCEIDRYYESYNSH